MTDSEKFIERWSRLKREQGHDSARKEPPEQELESTQTTAGGSPTINVHGFNENDVAKTRTADQKAKPSNLADLPAIDSIGAATDVRGFLKAGVPDELKRAALRRAWVSDPQIRNFIGLAENDWDFNASSGILGFGALPEADIARLLSQVIGSPAIGQEPNDKTAQLPDLSSSTQPSFPDQQPSPAAPALAPCGAAKTSPSKEMPKDNTPQHLNTTNTNASGSDGTSKPQHQPSRRHGGALPK